jgi:hypothetical protein
MRCINLGLGRTGTLSFREALNILGFGPVYHFTDLREHNFREQPNWYEVHRGHDVAENFDAIFKGYRSACDYPTALYPAQLLAAYPDAKFVLSIRDPEKWHKSVTDTIHMAMAKFRKLRYVHPRVNRLFKWADDVFFGPNGYHPNFEQDGVAQMLAHNAKVARVIPPHQLLVFDVRDGWAPLCAFLDVPVPDVLFPHVNDTEEFKRLARAVYASTVLSWLLTVLAAVGLVCLMLRWWFAVV